MHMGTGRALESSPMRLSGRYCDSVSTRNCKLHPKVSFWLLCVSVGTGCMVKPAVRRLDPPCFCPHLSCASLLAS